MAVAQGLSSHAATESGYPRWPGADPENWRCAPLDCNAIMGLLLRMIAVGPASGQYRQAAALAQSAHAWELLLERAGAHGVVPLVHRNLAALGDDELAGAARARVGVMQRAIRLRNLVMTDTLLDIVDLLRDSGVSVLPFKGPVLAAAAYGDLAMRQFDDLDIIVRARDRARAAQALSRYHSSFGRRGAAVADFFLCHEEPLQLERGLGTLDLHWGLNPSYFDYAPPTEELFARAQPVMLAGRSLPGPAIDDALLMVCVHASRHGWSRLNWVCDVAFLAARYAADEGGWEPLLRRAARLGCRRMLVLGLYLAGWMLGAALPAEIEPLLRRDRALRGLAARIAAPLFASSCPAQDWAHDFAIPVRTLERAGQQWRFAVQRLISPTLVDWATVPLPRALFGLYYLVRPVRLMVRLASRG